MQKRSLSIAGHRTSIALEPEFWSVLEQMAAARQMSIAGLVAEIDAARTRTNLSSEIRVTILKYLQSDGSGL